MERPPEGRDDNAPDDIVEKVRQELDDAEASGDDARLETLEKVRGELEAELDSSLENGPSRH